VILFTAEYHVGHREYTLGYRVRVQAQSSELYVGFHWTKKESNRFRATCQNESSVILVLPNGVRLSDQSYGVGKVELLGNTTFCYRILI
jgi:hypothetical protein